MEQAVPANVNGEINYSHSAQQVPQDFGKSLNDFYKIQSSLEKLAERIDDAENDIIEKMENLSDTEISEDKIQIKLNEIYNAVQKIKQLRVGEFTSDNLYSMLMQNRTNWESSNFLTESTDTDIADKEDSIYTDNDQNYLDDYSDDSSSMYTN